MDSILGYYQTYETPMAVNYVPEFISEVTRIAVFKKPEIYGMRGIVVDYRNGIPSHHSLSEFEAILNEVYKERDSRF